MASHFTFYLISHLFPHVEPLVKFSLSFSFSFFFCIDNCSIIEACDKLTRRQIVASNLELHEHTQFLAKKV